MFASFDPNAAAAKDSGVFGLPCSEHDAGVVLVPVPYDATTSYRAGTHRGPHAIFAASKQVDLFDRETGKPYEAGIYMRPIPEEVVAWNRAARKDAEKVIAEGGVHGDAALQKAADATNVYSEQMNQWVKHETERLLKSNKLIGIIGGDHSVPFGAIQAIAERHPGIGILHLDAHADLRPAYEGFQWSHASIMHNVMERVPGVAKLVQVGIRDFGEQEFDYIQASSGRIHTFFDADLKNAAHAGENWKTACDRIVAALPQEVYLSFDIDGLDPRFCPNTGTPVPGGLEFSQVTFLLKCVVESGRRIIAFDLNEVAPAASGEDEWDASVGARLLYKMIGFALR